MSPLHGGVRSAATVRDADGVAVTIPRGHAVLPMRLVRREARARRGRAARSGFVPEPGRGNADAAPAATLEAVAEALRAARGRRG